MAKEMEKSDLALDGSDIPKAARSPEIPIYALYGEAYGSRGVGIVPRSAGKPQGLVLEAASRYSGSMPRRATPNSVFAFNPFDPIRSEQRMLRVFMEAADNFDAKHGSSKAAARKQLLKEGVITKAGHLTKRFGG